MQEGSPVTVKDGKAEFTLDPMSYTTVIGTATVIGATD
jgi:hypothetical protein